MHEREYTSHREIKRTFVPNNDCGGCYVSIRSYLDKSLPWLIREYFSAHSISRKKNGRSANVA